MPLTQYYSMFMLYAIFISSYSRHKIMIFIIILHYAKIILSYNYGIILYPIIILLLHHRPNFWHGILSGLLWFGYSLKLVIHLESLILLLPEGALEWAASYTTWQLHISQDTSPPGEVYPQPAVTQIWRGSISFSGRQMAPTLRVNMSGWFSSISAMSLLYRNWLYLTCGYGMIDRTSRICVSGLSVSNMEPPPNATQFSAVRVLSLLENTAVYDIAQTINQ